MGTLVPGRPGGMWAMGGTGAAALSGAMGAATEPPSGECNAGVTWVGPVDPRRRTSSAIVERVVGLFDARAAPSSPRAGNTRPEQMSAAIIAKMVDGRALHG